MLTSQSFILYKQDHYSSQLLNYICLENEELSATNMSNKNKRAIKISETREESESPMKKRQASEKSEEKTKEKSVEKKSRASGKCSTCKIHSVDAPSGDGHKHVCPFRNCFCVKCIANTRRKDKFAYDIRLTRTKKIFERKQKQIEPNQRQIEITLSEEESSWPQIEMNLKKEKEGDYYDHEKFLDHLYNVIAETNVIEQSSFAMRVIKICFDVLTASLEDRIPKRVAEKASQYLRNCIQKMSNEEFQQQQQLQQQQHQLQQQQQQQQQLQQHQLPPPLLQHQQLQYSHWYNFLLDPRLLRSPTTYNYTYLKKETSPPEEFNVLLNQVRSSVPYKSLEFSSKYHW